MFLLIFAQLSHFVVSMEVYAIQIVANSFICVDLNIGKLEQSSKVGGNGPEIEFSGVPLERPVSGGGQKQDDDDDDDVLSYFYIFFFIKFLWDTLDKTNATFFLSRVLVYCIKNRYTLYKDFCNFSTN